MERTLGGKFNCIVHVQTVIPFVVLLSLWLERNGAKHQGNQMSDIKATSRVTYTIVQLCSTGLIKVQSWRGVKTATEFFGCYRDGACRQSKLVEWDLSQQPFIKLNADGAVSMIDSAGGGGITRDLR